MFQKGDLLWIPQNTSLIKSDPNNPASIWITTKPEVGIVIKSPLDKTMGFSTIIVDGSEWIIESKYLKHLRRKHDGQTSRVL